jgi:hypothetical protein
MLFSVNTQAGKLKATNALWRLTFGYSTVHHQILMLCTLEYQNAVTDKGMNARGIVHGTKKTHLIISSPTRP